MKTGLFFAKYFLLFSVLLLLKANAASILNHSRQLIVVDVTNTTTVHGKLQRYQRDKLLAKWHAVGAAISVVVGKNGASVQHGEGDDKSPLGIFPIISAFGIDHKEGVITRMPFRPIVTGTVCVDDSNSQYYNRVVDTNKIKNVDWRSGEQMFNYRQPYAVGLIIGYNMPNPVPKKGSCIFMHVWKNKNYGTAGCTAMKKKDMLMLLRWLKPQCNPVLIQEVLYGKSQHALV